MKTLNATISRASKGSSEGRSIWIDSDQYSKKQTLNALNNNFNSLLGSGDKFYLKVKIGNDIHTFNGHCNKSRGDFYIGNKEWKRVCNLEFPVGSIIKCEILALEY